MIIHEILPGLPLCRGNIPARAVQHCHPERHAGRHRGEILPERAGERRIYGTLDRFVDGLPSSKAVSKVLRILCHERLVRVVEIWRLSVFFNEQPL